MINLNPMSIYRAFMRVTPTIIRTCIVTLQSLGYIISRDL